MTWPGAPLALQIPWYWRWALRIEQRFETTVEQYAATAAAIAALLLLAGLLVVGGRWARERFADDVVRTVQWAAVTAATFVFTGFLVGVWELTAEVEAAFEFIAIGPSDLIRTLVTAIVFAGAYTATLLTRRAIAYGTRREMVSKHQQEIAHHIVQLVMFVPAIAFVVTLWGIPVESLFLGAGALGVVVGFAARKTLSGALSGFVILFARPFEVGDWITVSDREGIVTEVTLYNTQIRTFDEEHVLIPNDEVTGSEVTNFTRTDSLRLTTDVGIDYDADIAAAARVATEAMEECDAVNDTPSPDVIRRRFGDSEVVLRLRYWIQPPTIQHKWNAQNAVIEAVKAAFDREGIRIPFPQRELSNRPGTAVSPAGGDAAGERASGGDGTDETASGGDGTDETASGDAAADGGDP
ncbi:mechanosensitive channel [Halorubrum saccharovorum DSM 1137]|uniref:Mechanosensitive channel n=1 Tax=Halorubrum saccharovorum DSM 1137 TaxID=1227484 RepID=M0E550_9EURY|nr:mechanosensitive ion channel family protein [Halorubrum saccharovorum]ELZ42183.1 mechanosensitive channel [Halorubrum saccharovorum DSM 1137]